MIANQYFNLACLRIFAGAAFLATPCLSVSGQTLAASYPGYQTIKSRHWPAGEGIAGVPGQSKQIGDALRLRYGNNTDKRFGDGLRSTRYMQTPGVESNLRLTLSDNEHVTNGALRTHFYAQKINSDPRYKLLSINEVQDSVERFGRTDKDIRIRHQGSGIVTRMEVKQVKPGTINANPGKYKLQIDKMAAEARRTGEHQVWVNNKRTPYWFKDYAQRQGIEVHDNAVTGKGPGTPFASVLDKVDTQARAIGRARAVGGTASLAFGAMTAYASGRSLWQETERYIRGDRSPQLLLGMTRDTGFMVGGTGMAIYGGAEVSRLMVTSSKTLGQLTSISKYAGRLGWAGMALGGGVIAVQWYRGEVSTADVAHFAAVTGGGVAGAAGGAWAGAAAGAAIGSVVPIVGTAAGAVVGGIIGSVGGGAAGGAAADAAAQKIRNDAATREAAAAAEEADRRQKAREANIQNAIFAIYGVSER